MLEKMITIVIIKSIILWRNERIIKIRLVG